jgi:hypothetical protein
VAAAFSKALCIQGTRQAVYGNRHVDTSRQPVAFDRTTGSSMARSTCRTIVGAPQPEHMRCPPVRRSCLCESDFRVRGFSCVVLMFYISLNLRQDNRIKSDVSFHPVHLVILSKKFLGFLCVLCGKYPS